jgi:hypothetical protein
MKPLPTAPSAATKAPPGEVMPSLPSALASPSGSYSTANRRATACPVQRAYPWLLSASTLVAGLFCLLYITKPVISTHSALPPQATPATAKPALAMATTGGNLMPGKDSLPGEPQSPTAGIKPAAADPRHALPGPTSSAATPAFEETNIRIQHILTAQAPGGHLDRIDIDVPVLYQSRHLRWSVDEVAQARELLVRLMDYQEKARNLRAEGIGLLDSWNQLVENSIPAGDLRADSPSLPANQEDAADAPRPVGLITNESIQLQPAGK